MAHQFQQQAKAVKAATAIEVKRARLRQALEAQPNHTRYRQLLRASLQARFIQQASENGIFIGYTPSDGLLALELALALKDADLRVFLDEVDVPPDVDWQEAVLAALRSCGVLVMILSPEAMRDHDLQAARLACIRAGKIVIPVLAAPVPIRHLPEQMPAVDCSLEVEAGLTALLALLAVDKISPSQ